VAPPLAEPLTLPLACPWAVPIAPARKIEPIKAIPERPCFMM
jgi:hypothetical protein